MFEEESPNGLNEMANDDASVPVATEADVVGDVSQPDLVSQQDVELSGPAAVTADESESSDSAETTEPVAQVDAIPAENQATPVESAEPAIEVVPEPVAAQEVRVNIGRGDEDSDGIGTGAEAIAEATENTDTDADVESDDFIKEKVAKAKVAKKKASATATRARAIRKAKEKLPDLGDGSGYEPPDPVIPNPYSTEVVEPVDDALWYAVHCYSGYENKVKHSLEQRIETMGMAGKILEIVVPTEEEIEVRDGKRKTVERRVFPGYVIVKMRMSEDSWFVVRNTPGVTRFIGMGNRPQPLSPQEVNQILKRMEAEAPKIKVSFKTGQKVRITDGPFADLMGLVDRIDTEHAKVVVLVNFFGRDTPVELDFLQVEKM